MFDSEKYNPSCTVNFVIIRGDFQYVKKKQQQRKKKRHLTNSFIQSRSISFIIQLCVLGWFWQWREFVLWFFARQHLTISWLWHRLQCYRDSVLSDVQYRRAIHSEQSDEKEPRTSSLFCLLMSIFKEKRPAGPPPQSVHMTPSLTDYFVAPAQGSNLICVSCFAPASSPTAVNKLL